MFAWCLLSKALPTGMRAGRFSNHTSQICSKCTQQEDDFHLFFLCHFARAAWFAHPWFIRSDALVHNQDSLLTTITSLMTSYHPHASLQNIFNFLWSLWKARNDCLFERRKGHPNRIHVMAASTDSALQAEALLSSDGQNSVTNNLHNEQQIPLQGKSIQSDLIIKGRRFIWMQLFELKKYQVLFEDRLVQVLVSTFIFLLIMGSLIFRFRLLPL